MIFHLRKHIRVFVLLFSTLGAQAQSVDSIQLQEVVVRGYLSRLPLMKSPASAAIIDERVLQLNSQQSLLPAVNTIPGIRMEERSPGSYRLSVRGSLLRSPFGVRNVKVYLNNLPLTDASGNTYLNLIDPALIGRIEVLKGPDGSLFGANSGGVALFDLHESEHNEFVSATVSGGSYGMFRESTTVGKSRNRYQWNMGQAFQRADGYREQSMMKHFYGFVSGGLNYAQRNKLSFLVLYSDLQYETPGGLTLEQFRDDPAQARPAAGPNPGAAEQGAGVYNKTIFGGVTNDLFISQNFKHVLSVFGTHTDFQNPFITNYEVRAEKNTGTRTYLEYKLNKNNVGFQWNLGLEAQWGNQEISNYENDGGQQGAQVASDQIDISQAFYFTRAAVDIGKLTAEAAVSLNQYQYSFKGVGEKNLSNEWMPRFALSYQLFSELAVRASVSRGYSPPTIAEIRPSGNTINPDLEAESGWNREIGIRLNSWNGRMQLDASVFRFNLTNAIVRRTDENDVEYFLNAGGTNQTGFECLINLEILTAQESGIVRGIKLSGNYTLNNFTFDNYQVVDADYSGNKLTGVPRSIFILGLNLKLPVNLGLYVQSNTTSRIPLNDANVEYADQYDLLQVRLQWMKKFEGFSIQLFTGADNMLNQHYSLGNDINAFGNRYYNAAPLRNYYGGATFKL